MSLFYTKQTDQITPKAVQIALGKLLHDYLGTYTFKSGRTRKAISINKRDADANVTGLELVLQATFKQDNRYETCGFFLVEHGKDGTALFAATQILKHMTRRGGFTKPLNQNYELKQYLQTYCEIPVGELYKLIESQK